MMLEKPSKRGKCRGFISPHLDPKGIRWFVYGLRRHGVVSGRARKKRAAEEEMERALKTCARLEKGKRS